MNWRVAAPRELADADAARRWRRQGLLYAGLMPALSRLPTRWAYAAARLRGRWAARHGRDWVELSLGLSYIRARTEAAWGSVFPDATPAQLASWAVSRYETWVEEELEACWIAGGEWSRFAGLDSGPARRELARHPDHGVVLIQAHFNNPTLACAGLGMATSRPVWMTVSGVYEHARVHPCVRSLFDRKYRGAERLLNGGRLLHSESGGSMRQLYRALERGEIVIVVADLPPEPGQGGVCVPWLGQQRLLAAGAHRLASRTGSRLGTLSLHSDGPGHWTLHAEVEDVADADLAAERAYGRLGKWLMAEPGRWWAAHLLPDTPTCRPRAGTTAERR